MEKSEFRVLIKHCFLMGKNTVQEKEWLDKYYLDSAPLKTTIKRWYADLNTVVQTQMTLNTQVTQIQQLSWKTPKNFTLILAYCKLKLREIAEELNISEGSIFTILHEQLSMRKLCSKWVARLLTVNQKQCVNDSERCLQLFQCNKKGFLCKCDSG